jgi:ankyrin repeat protein
MFAASSTYGFGEVGAHGKGHLRWLTATEIIEDLVKAGAKVDTQNNEGETALMLAVKSGNEHFVKTLLSKGANPSIKNNKGLKAVYYAAKLNKERRETIRKMLDEKP